MNKLLAGLAVLLLSSAGSFAAIIPSLTLITPGGTTPESIAAGSTGNTYFYSLALAADTKLDPSRPFGQALVIYDFNGYIANTIGSASGNWVASIENSGPVVSPEIGMDPADDPSIPNLVFRYTGPVILGPQVAFDIVYADSIYSLAILDRYQGQGTKVVAPPDFAGENNTPTGTDGNVGVPQIPEPATMGMMSSGLLGLAFLLRRRRTEQ